MARVKEQLAFQVEQVKREAEMKVSQRSPESIPHRALPSLGSTVAVHSLGTGGRGGCWCQSLIREGVPLAPQKGVSYCLLPSLLPKSVISSPKKMLQ